MGRTFGDLARRLDSPAVLGFFRFVAYAAIPASFASGGVIVCVYGVAAYGFAAYLAGARPGPELRFVGNVLAGWYVTLLLIELANGGPPADVLRPAANYFVLLAFPSLVVGLQRLSIDIRKVETVALWTVAAAVAWSLVQFVFLHVDYPRGLKIGSILFGMVLLVWALFIFSRALHDRTLAGLPGVVAAASLIPLVLSGSKIVWACAILGFVVVLWPWARQERRWPALGLATAGLAALVALGSQLEATRQRFVLIGEDLGGFLANGDTTGGSFGLRYEAAVSGLRAFAERPWLGYGLKDVEAAAIAHRLPSFSDFSMLSHLHDDYVTHLVAFGIFGLVFVLSFLALVLVVAWRVPDPALRRFGIAATLMFALYMTAEIVFNQDPMYGLFFLVFGLLFLPARATPKA